MPPLKSLVEKSFFLLLILLIFSTFTKNSNAGNENRVEIEILNSLNYIEVVDSVIYLVTVGEIRNNLTFNVGSLVVNASYYDSDGTIIGTAYSYPEIDILTPQMKSPFIIYFHKKGLTQEDYEKISVRLTCSGSKTNKNPPPLPKVDVLTYYIDKDGFFTVSGQIRNTGPSQAYNIKIFLICYDSNQKLLGLSQMIMATELKVDHSIPFKISSKPFQITPSSFDVIAIARYEATSITRIEILIILVIVFLAFVVYMKKYRGW